MRCATSFETFRQIQESDRGILMFEKQFVSKYCTEIPNDSELLPFKISLILYLKIL
jgi:hypothetical protein